MKFTWFNLMPWPYLPDDFRDKNRSVWVDIDQAYFDPEKSHEVYNTYMDLLEYAGEQICIDIAATEDDADLFLRRYFHLVCEHRGQRRRPAAFDDQTVVL